MRLLGVGLEGINICCGMMDICKGLSKHAYDNSVKHIHAATTSVFEALTKKAVEEKK